MWQHGERWQRGWDSAVRNAREHPAKARRWYIQFVLTTILLAGGCLVAAASADWSLAFISGAAAVLFGFQCVQWSRIRKGGPPVSEWAMLPLYALTLLMVAVMVVYLVA